MKSPENRESSDFLPYELLTPAQRSILQMTADGLNQADIADATGKSIKTIDAHKNHIGGIGFEKGWIDYSPGIDAEPSIVIKALIQDGINFGYLHHEISSKTELMPLTRREEEVMEGLCNGESHKQVGKRLSVSVKTVECHKNRIYQKFGLENASTYSAIARYTYLKKHGMYEDMQHPERKKFELAVGEEVRLNSPSPQGSDLLSA